jgi:hypothetical protein
VNVTLEAVVTRLDEHSSRVDPRRVTLGPLVHRSANGSVFKGRYEDVAVAVNSSSCQADPVR